jgi:hypothetical protein
MTATETAIYSSVDRRMPSHTGSTWLLTLSETDELTQSTEISEKVRVMDIDVKRALWLFLNSADPAHRRGDILTHLRAEAATLL